MMNLVRYSSSERLLRLVLMLSASRGGLTTTEMAEQLSVSRRTAERLRGKLEEVAGPRLVEKSDGPTKRWTLYSTAADILAAPTMAEFAELKMQALELRNRGHSLGAERLESLVLKLEATLSRDAARRYAPDVEVFLESTEWLARPGPKLAADTRLLETLRQAMLEGRMIQLAYRRRGDAELTAPLVAPHGVLLGSRGYLVAFKSEGGPRAARVYALGNIESATLRPELFTREPTFNLRAFAARSFGVYWDGTRYDVEWRFSPKVANDAREYLFHPEQEFVDEADGSLTVRFRASGLVEMAWHLFRWGSEVRVVSPVELTNTIAQLDRGRLGRESEEK